MDVRPIRTEADYRWALAEIEPYFDSEPELGTSESDRFDVLAELISAYEARVHPIAPVDPVEMLHFAIEDMGRSQEELADLLGSAPRASEILNRKRRLTVEMIDKIGKAWKLPVEVLVRPYEINKPPRPKGTATKSRRRASRMTKAA